ncbi:MAG TPA: hypothetical protein VM884_00455 [Flavisolibacter sp.]|nr:hypothetical protein [Flavisolibacter sp.]
MYFMNFSFKKQLLFTLFSLSILLLSAQEPQSNQWSFKKRIEFWSKWQNNSIDAQVSLPGYIKTTRRGSTSLPITFDTITDNPLRHGATYVRLQTQTSYKNKIDLYGDLFAEHRGVSYGLFNQANTIVYPILRLEAKDTLLVFGKSILLKGRVGQFLDEKLDAGLSVYNIDLQGFQIKASYKSITLQYTLYGDMFNGIGLNIDDLKSYSLTKNSPDSQSFIGVSYVSARPPYYPLKNFFNLNVFGSRKFQKATLYGQVGVRPFSSPAYTTANALKHTALLLGLEVHGTKKKFDFSTKAEVRYYGFLFNLLYYDSRLRYKKPATDIYTMYANTVGEFLYPLRKFDTPFSQWAVFTEYRVSNTAMFTLTGSCNYRLSSKFHLFLKHDINYIKAKMDRLFSGPTNLNSNFLYPFFNAGISYKPADNVFARAGFTNKAMNLDIHYPTHYLFKNPQFELSLFASFN